MDTIHTFLSSDAGWYLALFLFGVVLLGAIKFYVYMSYVGRAMQSGKRALQARDKAEKAMRR